MNRPLIGILTSCGRPYFRGNHKNFIDLIRTGQKLGVLVCVLTPRSFLADQRLVEGFVLKQAANKQKWAKVRLPMPHVIYNRIPNRQVEQREAEQNALAQIKNNPHVQLFNHGFFDKWSLYQVLRADEEWRNLLPTTKSLDGFSTLKQMLEQYPILFVKPVNGKAGIGLMKISQNESQYVLTYQDQQGQKQYQLRHIEQLWKLIKHLTGDRSYLLQQAIPLASYQKRPCDFRVLVQKDGQGDWTLAGIGVRVAGKKAISTHVPMGGKIANVKHVLKALFPTNAEYVYQKLGQQTKGIAGFIEKSQGQLLAEMSMDIGIEASGRMWFFEANAKPMKFDEPQIRLRSLQNIIQYAQYISQQPATLKVGGIDQ